jgi:mannitol-1-/sugar-/sorbitol-6-phosphatase
MISIRCSALLFDLDGVLIDSTPAVSRVWSRWAIAHGFNPEKVVKMAHGRPSRRTISELLPYADVQKEDSVVERMEIEDLDGVVPLPGARELIEGLRPDRWTIATSCTRALANVRLRAAGLPIPATMVTSSDVRTGKPDPEPYLKAAANLNYAASACVVIEDAPAGISAGKSAGARVIGFTTTMSRAELQHAAPDWIVQDCTQIAASLSQDDLVLNLPI